MLFEYYKPSSKMKQLKFFLFMLLIFSLIAVLIDIVMREYHSHKYGPYKELEAEVLNFHICCSKSGSYRTHPDNLEVLINSIIYKTKSPFIGFYPWKTCIFGKFYPLYDSNFFNHIQIKNNKVKLLVDKNGNIYLGKTNAIISYSTLFILLLLLYISIKKIIGNSKNA